jgi:hypothetical protein
LCFFDDLKTKKKPKKYPAKSRAKKMKKESKFLKARHGGCQDF